MSDPCTRCAHYDCAMARGDVLPDHVTAWDHGTLYHPSAAGIARHDAIVEASRIAASIAVLEAVDRALRTVGVVPQDGKSQLFPHK